MNKICLQIATIALTVAGVSYAASSDDEQAAVSMINSLGGSIARDDESNIVRVDLQHAWVTDADLAKLAALTELAEIDLSYTKVTDLGLENLAPLQNIRVLNLRYAEYVGDVGIAHLKHWRNIEFLDLRGTKVTSTVFEHVAKMRQLKYLDVGHSRVSDELFENLADLDQLETLAFGGNKMSGTALPLLKLLPSLRVLRIGTGQRTDSGVWSVSVTDFNIDDIAGLEGLEVLDLNDAEITDRGIAKLANLQKLQELNLSNTRITSKGVAALRSLPLLKRLILRRTAAIDDSVISPLLELRHLEALDLTESGISGAQLADFARHEGLQQLLIGGIEAGVEQIEALRASMPECRISWWPPVEMEPERAR